MYLDKEFFERWMERIMDRFDLTDKALDKMKRRNNILNGERLYDNQDVCQLLNISKRTLQRYRSNGDLLYRTIYHKTYYHESDLHAFIRTHFEKREPEKDDTPPDEPEKEDGDHGSEENEHTNDLNRAE